jgi:hypothetical protein
LLRTATQTRRVSNPPASSTTRASSRATTGQADRHRGRGDISHWRAAEPDDHLPAPSGHLGAARRRDRVLPPQCRYIFHPITALFDPADDERIIDATCAFAAAMRAFNPGGAYLNLTVEADRVRDAYGDAKYARLVALEDEYDPGNLFRLTQNIRPSRPAAEPALA